MFDKVLQSIGEMVVKGANVGVNIAKSIKNKYIPQTTNLISNKLKDIDIKQTTKEIKEKISTATENIVEDVKNIKEKVAGNAEKFVNTAAKYKNGIELEKKPTPAYIRNGLPLKKYVPKFVLFPARVRRKYQEYK